MPPAFTDPLNCTYLSRLQFSDQPLRQTRHVDTLERQRDLVGANPRLKFLDWPGQGAELSLVSDDLSRLRELATLCLSNWSNPENMLPRLLHALSRSLKALRLSNITIRKNRHLSEVVLPNLEDLSISLRSLSRLDVVGLIGGCPSLTSFEIEIAGHQPSSQISQALRENCPQLRHLRVEYLRFQGDLVESLISQCTRAAWDRVEQAAMASEEAATAAEVAAPITTTPPTTTAASASTLSATAEPADATTMDDSGLGLISLHVYMDGVPQSVVPVVLQHSSTLQEVVLEDVAAGSVMETVPRILVECERLRRFSMSVAGTVSRSRDIFTLLTAESWGCWDLERFDMDFKLAEEEDEGEGQQKDDEIDGILETMHWRLQRRMHTSETATNSRRMHFSILLCMFQFLHQLEHLQVVCWTGSVYTRSRHVPVLHPPMSTWEIRSTKQHYLLAQQTTDDACG
ncbi:hypothetical protein BGX29_004334 [Mortierella sp. GBA35]|nr:hypothetical protein BGX29_004334 [Mortierella sp. GBA35]